MCSLVAFWDVCGSRGVTPSLEKVLEVLIHPLLGITIYFRGGTGADHGSIARGSRGDRACVIEGAPVGQCTRG
jgi:hypothetical protein